MRRKQKEIDRIINRAVKRGKIKRKEYNRLVHLANKEDLTVCIWDIHKNRHIEIEE